MRPAQRKGSNSITFRLVALVDLSLSARCEREVEASPPSFVGNSGAFRRKLPDIGPRSKRAQSSYVVESRLLSWELFLFGQVSPTVTYRYLGPFWSELRDMAALLAGILALWTTALSRGAEIQLELVGRFQKGSFGPVCTGSITNNRVRNIARRTSAASRRAQRKKR